jgi:hypothetical protein
MAGTGDGTSLTRKRSATSLVRIGAALREIDRVAERHHRGACKPRAVRREIDAGHHREEERRQREEWQRHRTEHRERPALHHASTPQDARHVDWRPRAIARALLIVRLDLTM